MAKKTQLQENASKGGRARASVLTPQERSEIARDAAKRRWIKTGTAKEIESRDADGRGPTEILDKQPYSLFRGILEIGNVQIECHVLSNGMRVLTQREVVRIL